MTKTGFPPRLRMSHQAQRLNQNYRRNGKLQSCEPCRKGKLRCDHMLPTCSRCARRNRSEQCVYHPAPLTKAKETSPNGSHSASPPAVRRRTQSPRLTQLTTSRTPSSRYDAINVIEDDSILDASTTGFLGATSFSEIWADNQLPIGSARHMPAITPVSSVTEARIERGAKVLRLLRDEVFINKCIERWFVPAEGIIVNGPMMKQWAAEMYSSHRKCLQSGKDEDLLELSQLVWENTQVPLKFDGNTTPRQWVSLSTGTKLRWEVVGLICTVVGLLCMSLFESDLLFEEGGLEGPVDRNVFAQDIGAAADTCILFCRDLSLMNDLTTWLTYENCALASRFWGRSSSITWQRTGEVNNVLIAMGLHQEIKADEHTPWFLTEFRKKVFIFCYAMDKQLATFLGRPPRLCKRYCLLQLPLDLNDAQIMSDTASFEDVAIEVDDRGWNRRGSLHRCTIARIYAQNASIREDILELSLSVGRIVEEEIFARAQQIQSDADRVFHALPPFLLREDDCLWEPRKSGIETLFLIFIRIQYLEHAFLLQRALMKRADADRIELVRIAGRIFSNCLVMVNNRDALRDFQLDIGLVVHAHGLPSAAVLAVELLHQDQSPQTASPLLPRSETIQNLSVFTSYLASLSADSGIRTIAGQGRHFLRTMLDKILTPVSLAQVPALADQINTNLPNTADQFAPDGNNTLCSGGLTNSALDVSLEMENSFFTSGTDADFVKWLDIMAWESDSNIAGGMIEL